MIVGSEFNPGLVLLGSTFLQNYFVIFDFKNNSIGFNGYYIEVVPPHNDDSTTLSPTIITIICLAGVLLLGGIGVAVYMINKKRKLNKEINRYSTLEEMRSSNQDPTSNLARLSL